MGIEDYLFPYYFVLFSKLDNALSVTLNKAFSMCKDMCLSDYLMPNFNFI